VKKTDRSLPLIDCSPSDVPAPVQLRRDAQDNHDRILAACRALIKSHPTAAPSMDEVASHAGVGKGTLYRRFADKTTLFLALLDNDSRILQDRVQRRFGLPRATAPSVVLVELWLSLVDFAVDHAEVLAAAETHADLGDVLSSAPNHWRHIELVRQLRANGTSASLAPMMADALLASLSAPLIRRERSRGRDPRETLQQLMASIVYRSL
jgi:AcrR family transcriptional regulator